MASGAAIDLRSPSWNATSLWTLKRRPTGRRCPGGRRWYSSWRTIRLTASEDRIIRVVVEVPLVREAGEGDRHGVLHIDGDLAVLARDVDVLVGDRESVLVHLLHDG